ncbi:MAG: hypothetical protein QXI71_02710 [Candidatus Bathyarchaeia archaeon]
MEVERGDIQVGDHGTDAINIESIANALKMIVYSNDNQVKEIKFKQISSQRDLYEIRIREL